ncbi:MAG: hypothetical protein OXT65_00210 [Alphaproteobacteria bacterium]|nr:hypothetical protein [Alphaproteobacteria bacterium]
MDKFNPESSDKKGQMVGHLRKATLLNVQGGGGAGAKKHLIAAIGAALHPDGFKTAAEAVDFVMQEMPPQHSYVAGAMNKEFREAVLAAKEIAQDLGNSAVLDAIAKAEDISQNAMNPQPPKKRPVVHYDPPLPDGM